MKRKRTPQHLAADPMAARFTRLSAKIQQGTKPIIWLRAIAGTGKTRFLQWSKSHEKNWRMLDFPTRAVIQSVLSAKSGILDSDPTKQKLIIAARDHDDTARS